MEIQDFLIAALQNILILANHSKSTISKSNVQIGQFIRAKRAILAGFFMRSFVICLTNQLILPFSLKRQIYVI